MAARRAADAANRGVEPSENVTRGAGACGGLPAVPIDPALVTVSGISSGAFQAVQLHVSYSATFKGVAALAGGPYWCAQDNVETALGPCMKSGKDIDVGQLVSITRTTAATGFADDPANMAAARVWIFSAINDTVVALDVAEALLSYYQAFVTQSPGTNIHSLLHTRPGEHSQQTDAYGDPCNFLAKSGDIYMNDCNYDSAGAMLQHLYAESVPGGLRAAQTPTSLYNGTGHYVQFLQQSYVLQPWSTAFGLDTTGYAYVPRQCAASFEADLRTVRVDASTGAHIKEYWPGSGAARHSDAHAGAHADANARGFRAGGAKCALHVALHGCLMGHHRIGMDYVVHAGYNAWADANGIVVIYPQALPTLLNPRGCWDWWGYSGTAYASNLGVQPAFVKMAVDTVMGTL